MYQSAEKRVAAVTANNGPGSTFFGSAYQAKRLRSRMIFCPVLPRVPQCGRTIGLHPVKPIAMSKPEVHTRFV
jgi:hypothetical protein